MNNIYMITAVNTKCWFNQKCYYVMAENMFMVDGVRKHKSSRAGVKKKWKKTQSLCNMFGN